MKLTSKLLLTTILLILPNLARAHDDGTAHKGPKVEGTAVSVEDSIIRVKTNDQTLSVELTKNTKFQLGMNGTPAKKADVTPGTRLMVVGHKLESGNFGATEIMIHDKH